MRYGDIIAFMLLFSIHSIFFNPISAIVLYEKYHKIKKVDSSCLNILTKISVATKCIVIVVVGEIDFERHFSPKK